MLTIAPSSVSARVALRPSGPNGTLTVTCSWSLRRAWPRRSSPRRRGDNFGRGGSVDQVGDLADDVTGFTVFLGERGGIGGRATEHAPGGNLLDLGYGTGVNEKFHDPMVLSRAAEPGPIRSFRNRPG